MQATFGWRAGSVHAAQWPVSQELHRISAGSSERIVAVTAAALQAIRKVKSDAKVSQRTELAQLTLQVPAADAADLEAALADLKVASRVTGTLDVVEGGDETITLAHVFAAQD